MAGMYALSCSRRLTSPRDERNVPDENAFSKGRFTNHKRQAVQVPAEACLARLLQRLDKAGDSALGLRTTSQTLYWRSALHQHNTVHLHTTS